MAHQEDLTLSKDIKAEKEQVFIIESQSVAKSFAGVADLSLLSAM